MTGDWQHGSRFIKSAVDLNDALAGLVDNMIAARCAAWDRMIEPLKGPVALGGLKVHNERDCVTVYSLLDLALEAEIELFKEHPARSSEEFSAPTWTNSCPFGEGSYERARHRMGAQLPNAA